MLSDMPSACTTEHLLCRLKEISGRRIEDGRRLKRMTQRQFARNVGLSTRWLREIENGNPIVKLDDHLLCAANLGLSPTYIFLPLLYRAYGRRFPVDLALRDLAEVERRVFRIVAREAAAFEELRR